MRFSLSILCLILAAPITASAQEAAVPKHVHVVENCVVQYISKVDVPARAEGTLTVLKVDEGLTVEKDQVLAVIDDTAAQINVALKMNNGELALSCIILRQMTRYGSRIFQKMNC